MNIALCKPEISVFLLSCAVLPAVVMGLIIFLVCKDNRILAQLTQTNHLILVVTKNSDLVTLDAQLPITPVLGRGG